MNRLLTVDKPPTCAGEWLMPDMRPVVVLGGSHDGERVLLPENRNYIHFIKPQPNRLTDVTPNTSVSYDTELYVIRALRGDTQTFYVLTPPDWTGDQVMAHLLAKATR